MDMASQGLLHAMPGLWIALAISFFWMGLVSAISFMEAWLKFRAPGVTRAIGLSIGKRVFTALNKLEWICLLILAVGIILLPDKLALINAICFALSALILLVQTIFWLPTLKKQADVLIEGKAYTGKSVHVPYVIAEIIKVLALFVSALLLGFQHFS